MSPPESRRFDVVVAGAGTAGSACALALARSGLRVALLERRRLARAGARWINQVPGWLLRAAGWWPLAKNESEPPPPVFHVAGPQGKPRVSLEQPDLFPVRVGALVDRLHGLCREVGVSVFEQVSAGQLEVSASRVVALQMQRPAWRLEAALFVDASGVSRALADQVPALGPAGWAPQWLCSARQHIFAVRDRSRALDFCRRQHLQPGESLACNGVAGAFSTLALRFSPDLRRIELLAGCVSHLSAGRLLDEFARRHRWLGRRQFGGGGLIPLWPRSRLFVPGLALVGDAAGQVFAAHASGTGAGLMAARLLAQACAAGSDPGSEKTLSDYARRWRRFAGAGFPAAAAFTAALIDRPGSTVADLLELFDRCPQLLRQGLEQNLQRPSLVECLAATGWLAVRPRRLARLAELGWTAARNLWRDADAC